MSDDTITAERVLDAAERVLRRYGIGKTTVVDVARHLEVSHGTIYRHFPNKAALQDAVAARWLARVSAPLAVIADGTGAADERLRQWFVQLRDAKRGKVLDDPELFATYHALAEQARGVVEHHVEELTGQLQRIVEQGIADGSFGELDAARAARAAFDATLRFHHPAHSREWNDEGIDDAFETVLAMVITALRTGIQPAVDGDPSRDEPR